LHLLCFSVEESLLQEVGLLRDGLLTEAAGTALWACDEKGLESTDGKVKFHRAAAPKALGKVTADVPSASWGHVTLLPFVSLDGHVGPPNVILQGSSFMKSWSKVWPAANVAANEKASCTADLFSQFVLLWARHCRDVLQVPGLSLRQWWRLLGASLGRMHTTMSSVECAIVSSGAVSDPRGDVPGSNTEL
jgi:hypothetical protein